MCSRRARRRSRRPRSGAPCSRSRSAPTGTTPRARARLDLRVGATVRVVGQAAWDRARAGELADVVGYSAAGGHVLLRMVRTGEVRRLGRWWLDAALDARAAERLGAFPVVPVEEAVEEVVEAAALARVEE